MIINFYCILLSKVHPTPNLLFVNFAERDEEVVALCVLSGVFKIKEHADGVLEGTMSDYADRVATVLKSRKREYYSTLECSANDTKGAYTGCYHCRLKLGVIGWENASQKQIICAG